jgi:hypothetical protein
LRIPKDGLESVRNLLCLFYSGLCQHPRSVIGLMSSPVVSG